MSEVEELRARVIELEEQIDHMMRAGNFCPDCFRPRHHTHACSTRGCLKQPCQITLVGRYCCEHVPSPPPPDRFVSKEGVLYREIDPDHIKLSPGLADIQFTDEFRVSP